MSTSPIQSSGSISFVEDDAVRIAGSVILADKIAFDFDYGRPGFPEMYNVVLARTSEDWFEGYYTVRGSPTLTGKVTCRMYTGANGTALIGNWLEDGKRYLWFAEFPVETSKPPSPKSLLI